MKNLFTFLILNILFTFSLMGTTLQSRYKITFGLFGTLGYATTTLNKIDETYYIRMEVKSVGLAKVLSGNRKEIYESRGKVVKGILVPELYKKTKSNNRYTKIKKFTFDHNNSQVLLEKNSYNVSTKKSENSKETYKFYAKNDILTLYFNILELIKTSDSTQMVFHAIGGKKENGRIDIQKLQGEQKEKIEKLLGVDSESILKVTINQKIFSSKNGELFISISTDNLCSHALLKDVILFGDIKGSKIPLKN